MPMLRVTHLSTTDIKGGAALAAYRLHQALPERGVHSSMFVASRHSEDPNVIEFKPSIWGPRGLNHLLFRAARRIQRRPLPTSGGVFMTHDYAYLGGLAQRQVPDSDVFHFHWAMDLLDFRMLPRFARRAPIAWTFHDMNAFTGGCHYDRDCGRFTNACGACPILNSTDLDDITHQVLERKVASLQEVPESRMIVICPSRWMEREVQRSRAFGRFATEVIPNGIDHTVFRPLDRAAIRRKYQIAPEDRVVFFIAESIDDPRKGWAELQQAVGQLSHLPNLRILTLGRGDTGKMQGPLYRHLGGVHDPEKVCEAYNLADIFVIPTRQDNFPNTVLESMASGTPVVGFATGGVGDAVEDGISGLLTPTGNIDGLARNMIRALSDEELRISMGHAARERAVEFFSLERQTLACSALYRRLTVQATQHQPLETPAPFPAPGNALHL
jgi:glycosyltransferase involved in cell wall biosynthesis